MVEPEPVGEYVFPVCSNAAFAVVNLLDHEIHGARSSKSSLLVILR